MSPTAYAKQLGVSTETVRRWIREGKLQASRVNGKYEIPHDTTHPPHDATQTPHTETHTAEAIARAELRAQSLLRCLFGATQQTEHIATLKGAIAEKEALVNQLFEERNRLQQTLDEVLGNQRDAGQRSDTIILSLTQQVKQQQVLIEDLRAHNVPLWRRFLRLMGKPQAVETQKA